MHWQQTAAIKINNNISGYQKIKKGVSQGCVLSPDLFSLYSEITLSTVKDRPGIRIGGANINNLQYADDIVLIAKKRRRITRFVTYDQRREWMYGIEFEYEVNRTHCDIKKERSTKLCYKDRQKITTTSA